MILRILTLASSDVINKYPQRHFAAPRIRENSMPLYEFICLDCGAEFESLVWKASETSQVNCPACGGKELEEKISRFASVSKDRCAPSGG